MEKYVNKYQWYIMAEYGFNKRIWVLPFDLQLQQRPELRQYLN